MCSNAMSIALRHVKIIARLADLGDRGGPNEPVDQLVKTTVRNCLLAMQAAGCEAVEAAESFEQLLQQELANLPQEREQYRHILEIAYLHAEYLGVVERSLPH